jgi:hypothetical protein
MDAPEDAVHPVPCDPAVAAFVAGLDADAREFFEQRAAIVQFEGGVTRAAAQAQARDLTRAYLARRSNCHCTTEPPG